MAKNNIYYNYEGYHDPTAGKAIQNIGKGKNVRTKDMNTKKDDKKHKKAQRLDLASVEFCGIMSVCR